MRKTTMGSSANPRGGVLNYCWSRTKTSHPFSDLGSLRASHGHGRNRNRHPPAMLRSCCTMSHSHRELSSSTPALSAASMLKSNRSPGVFNASPCSRRLDPAGRGLRGMGFPAAGRRKYLPRLKVRIPSQVIRHLMERGPQTSRQKKAPP